MRHVSASTDFTVGKNQHKHKDKREMAKYIYKYQFEKLLLYTEPNLWKKLVPNQSSTMLVFAPEEWQKTIMQRSWQKYDIERNPFYQLQKAQEILREGFITQTLFYSIKKKCVSAYWKKNFTFTAKQCIKIRYCSNNFAYHI